MNYKLIQNNLIKNQNLIVLSSVSVAGLSAMIYQGVLNTCLLFFGLILPIYQIINIISQILPLDIKNITLQDKYQSILKLTQWNLILANHLIFDFITTLIIYIDSFYIKIIQLIILYIMYKFGDSVNDSFDTETNSESSDTINNNIVLTDMLLLVNKDRVSFFNKVLNYYLKSIKDVKSDKGFVETFSHFIGTEQTSVAEQTSVTEQTPIIEQNSTNHNDSDESETNEE